MRLEQHIAPLLYRHHCVVVPEFGAFLTQRRAAYYNVKTQSFLPPSKSLSFNEQLQTSDGVLVSYIAAVQSCSYEQALEELMTVVQGWKSDLVNGISLDLEDIGLLSKNTEGALVFQPYHHQNYLLDSFGLSPVHAAALQLPALSGVRKLPQDELHSEFKLGKSFMKYAAIGLIAVSTALGGLQLRSSYENNTILAAKTAQETITKTLQEANFFSDNPIDLPALEIELSLPKPAQHYFIVAGSFIKEKNAKEQLELLKTQGYPNASIIGQNAYGLYQVGLQAFAEEMEARRFLSSARSNGSEAAWLLIK